MAGIDYGLMVFKNGQYRYEDTCEIGNIIIGASRGTVYFYDRIKRDDVKKYSLAAPIGFKDHKSKRFNEYGISFHLKQIGDSYTHKLTFQIGKDQWIYLFGYGIDDDFRIWNKVKVDYIGKFNSRKIDNEIRKAFSISKGDEKFEILESYETDKGILNICRAKDGVCYAGLNLTEDPREVKYDGKLYEHTVVGYLKRCRLSEDYPELFSFGWDTEDER